MYFYVHVSRVTRASGIKESEAIFPFKIDHTHKNEFKSYFFACSVGGFLQFPPPIKLTATT
jgi:hypothetical protein